MNYSYNKDSLVESEQIEFDLEMFVNPRIKNENTIIEVN